ncbi:unnamed protein product [Linum tenue]|uniref:Uncharacterized protein n=1 Tax=Linum tenue TaxID=586396 RepID=A0AAV0M5R5_9ROSI|nr:unnamed protein product [Linum tenue]
MVFKESSYFQAALPNVQAITTSTCSCITNYLSLTYTGEGRNA